MKPSVFKLVLNLNEWYSGPHCIGYCNVGGITDKKQINCSQDRPTQKVFFVVQLIHCKMAFGGQNKVVYRMIVYRGFTVFKITEIH